MTTPVPQHCASGTSLDFRLQIVEAAHEDWLDPYDDPDDYRKEVDGTPDPNWCGHYAGAVARRAGLAHDIAKHVMQSTYRLASHEFAEDKIGWVNTRESPPKSVPVADVRTGDIITLETSGGKPYGDHIAIVYHVAGDWVYTYEGNSKSGIIADTLEPPRVRSVVRCRRRIRKVRRVYRFGMRHREVPG